MSVMREQEPKGSLSVFFAMILPLVFALFFSMLEVTRIRGLDRNARELAVQVIESAFSEYQPILWEQYRLLALDMGYAAGEGEIGKVSGRMMELGSWYGNTGDERGQTLFLTLMPAGCDIVSYGLLTDQDGAPLIHMGAAAAGEETTSELVQQWISFAQQAEEDQNTGVDLGALVTQGEAAMEEAREQTEQQAEQQTQEPGELTVSQTQGRMPRDHPLTLFREWEEKGILALLVSPDRELSGGFVDPTDVVSARTLRQGKGTAVREVDLTDRVMFGQYLLQHFSSFQNPDAQCALQYQVEYVIGGSAQDRENLKAVAGKILGLREVQNLIALISDQTKMQQALEAATALAGFTGNPAIIQVVQLAVLGVWAFVESVLDVRLLLEGGKVPFVKDSVSWTSDLFALGQYVSPEVKARDSESGISYQDYLRVLLAVVSVKDLGLRACDVLEIKLNGSEPYANVRMDHMIYQMEAECTCQGRPVFFGLFFQEARLMPSYSFTKKVKLSYLQ